MHCEANFDTKYRLKRHAREIHNKNFKCTDCDISFKFKWKLEQHLVTEQKAGGDFECNICG